MFKNYFSLIELLVVVAILGLIASIVSPSIQKAYEHSRAIACQAQLRPIYLADNNYSNDHANLIYGRNTNLYATGDGRFYWNHSRSPLRPYIDPNTLQCPSDPYASQDYNKTISRDGISFGRNSRIYFNILSWDLIQDPRLKVFYGDSGHRFSDPIERDQASRRNLSSSNRIQGRSAWNNEGVFARHSFKEANVLFFDGHTERLDNVDVDIPESINYSLNDEMYNKHWLLID